VADLGAPVDASVFAPSGEAVVASTSDGRVVVIDPLSGRVRRDVRTGEKNVLLASTGAVAVAWGRRGAELVRPDGTRMPLRGPRPKGEPAFSTKGEYLATLHADGVARVWRADDGARIGAVHVDPRATAIAVTRTGDSVAVAVGRTVRIFDVATSRLVRRISAPAAVTKVIFGPSGRFVAFVVGPDDTVRTVEARTGRLFDDFRGHTGDIVDLAFNGRGTRLATASTDGTARVWKVGSRGQLAAPVVGHTNYVESVSFGRRGELVATASRDGTARVARADSGQSVAAFFGHRDRVSSASLSPTGRVLATGSLDGTVRLWDAVGQPQLVEIGRRPYQVAAARFDGRRIVVAPKGAVDLAVGGGHTATAVGRTVRVDNHTFGVPARATGVAIAPGGRRVAVAGFDGAVRIYDVRGRLRRTLRETFAGAGKQKMPPLRRVAYSPDGRRVAAGSTDATAKVWDLATGRLTVLSSHKDDVMSARFSPDGSHIVTASRDHDVRVWNARTGVPEHLLDAHFAIVSDAAYSPDGRFIVTAGPQLAGLFRADSGKFLTFLQGHEGPVTSASFDASSRVILTSGVDGTVRRWVCDICGGLDSLLRLARGRLDATGRKLTPSERRQYLG
jgi:WD40 repeat protein